MKRLFHLNAKNLLCRFAPSALPQYMVPGIYLKCVFNKDWQTSDCEYDRLIGRRSSLHVAWYMRPARWAFLFCFINSCTRLKEGPQMLRSTSLKEGFQMLSSTSLNEGLQMLSSTSLKEGPQMLSSTSLKEGPQMLSSTSLKEGFSRVSYFC